MEMIIRQTQYFCAAFFWGCILMWVYDLLRVFRLKVKHGWVWNFLEDWTFWGLSAILVFQMIFSLNYGIMRVFFVVSFVLGMLGYRKCVKDRFVRLVSGIFTLFFRPYVWIWQKITKKRKKGLK